MLTLLSVFGVKLMIIGRLIYVSTRSTLSCGSELRFQLGIDRHFAISLYYCFSHVRISHSTVLHCCIELLLSLIQSYFLIVNDADVSRVLSIILSTLITAFRNTGSISKSLLVVISFFFHKYDILYFKLLVEGLLLFSRYLFS